jgi:FAD dependent oxidoreductase TIGR03364
MKHFSADVAVVGGGIVGLAHAYAALRRGFRVVLFERDDFAVSASIRNFGLIWPIGQEAGKGLLWAMNSREHWLNIGKEAGFGINQNGSLHLAMHDDELKVLSEFVEMNKNQGYDCVLLEPDEVMRKSGAVRRGGLKGGLWSTTECTVNPREAIRKIPLWLKERHHLELRFGQAVNEIQFPILKTSGGEAWTVDYVFVCSGAEFRSLYPRVFDQPGITKCRLQMMKASSTDPSFVLGPTLCGGLTLRHYAAFRNCPSLPLLDARFNKENMAWKDHGIHVLLAQHGYGELIIGDSHHYGSTHEPFDHEAINDIILAYLQSFAMLPNLTITERWHGVYPRIDNDLCLIAEPEKGVTVVNCLGGAGMTLSFGVAEETVARVVNE